MEQCRFRTGSLLLATAGRRLPLFHLTFFQTRDDKLPVPATLTDETDPP